MTCLWDDEHCFILSRVVDSSNLFCSSFFAYRNLCMSCMNMTWACIARMHAYMHAWTCIQGHDTAMHHTWTCIACMHAYMHARTCIHGHDTAYMHVRTCIHGRDTAMHHTWACIAWHAWLGMLGHAYMDMHGLACMAWHACMALLYLTGCSSKAEPFELMLYLSKGSPQ